MTPCLIDAEAFRVLLLCGLFHLIGHVSVTAFLGWRREVCDGD